MLYKPLILSLTLILTLGFSEAYADSDGDKKKNIEWFFVMTAKKGEIKKNELGQYKLTLAHVKYERVMAFSNKPNRIVKYVSPEYLWGGRRSFEKAPLNAVAVFGQEKIALKVMSVSFDKDKVVFITTSDDNNTREVIMDDVFVCVDEGHVGDQLLDDCTQSRV